jgi:hypothetical protein
VAFSFSVLICSSLICHSDWQEQTPADAVEPDVPSKVEYLMFCWQLPLNLRLVSLEQWTLGSDVTGDTAVMTGRQASLLECFLTVFADLRLAFSQIILPLRFICSYAEGHI